MCIRDSLGVEYLITGALTELGVADRGARVPGMFGMPSVKVGSQKMDASIDARMINTCLLYTSDAADERSSVDLGGRRIIKKKKIQDNRCGRII